MGDGVGGAEDGRNILEQDTAQVGLATTQRHILVNFAVFPQREDPVGQHSHGLIPTNPLQAVICFLATLFFYQIRLLFVLS